MFMIWTDAKWLVTICSIETLELWQVEVGERKKNDKQITRATQISSCQTNAQIKFCKCTVCKSRPIACQFDLFRSNVSKSKR